MIQYSGNWPNVLDCPSVYKQNHTILSDFMDRETMASIDNKSLKFVFCFVGDMLFTCRYDIGS